MMLSAAAPPPWAGSDRSMFSTASTTSLGNVRCPERRVPCQFPRDRLLTKKVAPDQRFFDHAVAPLMTSSGWQGGAIGATR